MNLTMREFAELQVALGDPDAKYKAEIKRLNAESNLKDAVIDAAKLQFEYLTVEEYRDRRAAFEQALTNLALVCQGHTIT